MSILDLFFPKKCVSCGTCGEYLCPSCFATLSFDVPQRCLVCGTYAIYGVTHPLCRREESIDGAFCGVVYTKSARKVIACLKYAPYVHTVSSLLTQLVCESVLQNAAFVQIAQTKPMLVPIPLSGKRARKRGYNQAYILAKQIGRQLSLSVVDALARTKDTKPQFGLTKSERFNNMKNTFNIKDTFRKTRSSVVHHASILLVDDVLTTGATVMEAAKVLKKNGIQKVWALCVAAD